MSVRSEILDALQYGILNNISIANGYNYDMGEVNKEEVAFSDRRSFPSVDLIWGQELYLNGITGLHTTGLYEKVADMFIEGWLEAQEDMFEKKEMFVADIEKYFGTNYWIPDSNGDKTTFNCMLASNDSFGMKRNQPKGGVSMLLKIYYRIDLTNPDLMG